MTQKRLTEALRKYKAGKLGEEEVLALLKDFPYQDLGFAKVDHHRSLRHGCPEVIFGRGKTSEQILEITKALCEKGSNVLITAAGEKAYQDLKAQYPACEFHPNCQAVTIIQEPPSGIPGQIGILSAGTADIPVAEEARVTAEFMGNSVSSSYDVGVAGLHRLLDQRETLEGCSVLIVVAGMEGALPSVVGGLVGLPVIAVPTSIGYGASFQGVAALLGMLNSCASNVAVVNIDNGFGAGYVASLINRQGLGSLGTRAPGGASV